MAFSDELHVAVGVVSNPAGEVLIAQRRADVHQGGLWEFPGGKVEPGESVRDALRRELKEELDISVITAFPLIKIRHRYPERCVRLEVFRVRQFSGTPWGRENQSVVWTPVDKLKDFAFLSANRSIVTAARLPDYYAILDAPTGDLIELLRRLDNFLRIGVKLIQLRASALDADQYRKLAERVGQCCAAVGVNLLLNTPIDEFNRTQGAAGIHLSSKQLLQLRGRPLEENDWVAASCHNLAELRRAEQLGIDFAVLSPVLPTLSHPGAEPLGWQSFADLVDQTNIPVYALGGLALTDLERAQEHGAQGIAGIRGFIQ